MAAENEDQEMMLVWRWCACGVEVEVEVEAESLDNFSEQHTTSCHRGAGRLQEILNNCEHTTNPRSHDP